MGAYSLEATQVAYRGGAIKMSVEEALKNVKGGTDYTADKSDTGQKWLDGSTIWQRVIYVGDFTFGSGYDGRYHAAFDPQLGEGVDPMIITVEAYGSFTVGSGTSAYSLVLELTGSSPRSIGVSYGPAFYDSTNKELCLTSSGNTATIKDLFFVVTYIALPPAESEGE